MRIPKRLNRLKLLRRFGSSPGTKFSSIFKTKYHFHKVISSPKSTRSGARTIDDSRRGGDSELGGVISIEPILWRALCVLKRLSTVACSSGSR